MICTDAEKICQWLDNSGRERVIALQRKLTAIPALAPENGGQGEMEKALAVESELPSSAQIEHCDSPDPRVPEGLRPNIIARIPGKSPRMLWLMGHLDVVPPGDSALWNSAPWQAHVDGDLIYGRGVEDNQQAVVSMLILAQAATACGAVPEQSLGLLFVADEECGSVHGMEYVMKKRPELFRKDDLVIVPDMGAADGSLIEVAEKSIFWVRVEVSGVQCHASTPSEGKNALLAVADMILHTQDVAALFPKENPLFDGPSTFTPTRHEENVPNINTVPGRGVFYVDCRVLPGYTSEEVLNAFRRVFEPIAARHGVTADFSLAQNTPAPPSTSPECPAARFLASAIRRLRGVEARCMGVGGGTVAAVFRRAGIPAVVWGTQDGTMHRPNENSRISHTVEDAKVFTDILFHREEQ